MAMCHVMLLQQFLCVWTRNPKTFSCKDKATGNHSLRPDWHGVSEHGQVDARMFLVSNASL